MMLAKMETMMVETVAVQIAISKWISIALMMDQY
jgi:hypothetical protein